MTIGARKWNYLNEKMCFDYWIKHGTIRKAHQALIEERPLEMRNPATNRNYTFMAVSQASWRWVLHNLEEAHPLMIDAWAAKGEVLDDETWKTLLVTIVFSERFTKPFRDRFIEKHGLQAYVGKRLEMTTERT
jgi:hypothetical protein